MLAFCHTATSSRNPLILRQAQVLETVSARVAAAELARVTVAVLDQAVAAISAAVTIGKAVVVQAAVAAAPTTTRYSAARTSTRKRASFPNLNRSTPKRLVRTK